VLSRKRAICLHLGQRGGRVGCHHPSQILRGVFRAGGSRGDTERESDTSARVWGEGGSGEGVARVVLPSNGPMLAFGAREGVARVVE
jgi:hypothetical protein